MLNLVRNGLPLNNRLKKQYKYLVQQPSEENMTHIPPLINTSKKAINHMKQNFNGKNADIKAKHAEKKIAFEGLDKQRLDQELWLMSQQ